MVASQARKQFTELLSQPRCVSLASVYDPISIRIAERAGFEFGLAGGSMVSLAVLGAPDLALLTLTELVEQVGRVTRAGSMPVVVDGDHGYGNALSVMRTIAELERVGAAAVTIEDTALPRPFGTTGEMLISLEEGAGKIKAAVAARRDPSFAVIGRTHALRITDEGDALRRALAYAAAGADAIFILGASSLAQLETIHAKTALPLLLAQYDASLASVSLADFARCGVRAVLKGHDAFWAGAAAIDAVFRATVNGGSAGAAYDLPTESARAMWTNADVYHDAAGSFLG